MYDAEQQNATLKADVNYMENYKALEDIKDFENMNMSSQFALSKKATVTAKLPTLGSTVIDPNLQSQNLELKAENEKLKKMMAELQAKMTNLLQSKTDLSEQAEGSLKQKESTVVDLENKLILIEEEKGQAVEKCENMRQELFNVKDELKKKVNQLT